MEFVGGDLAEVGGALGLACHGHLEGMRAGPHVVGVDPLDAAACPDGANFMFWSGRDFQVSGGQAYVLVRSPVVR